MLSFTPKTAQGNTADQPSFDSASFGVTAADMILIICGQTATTTAEGVITDSDGNNYIVIGSRVAGGHAITAAYAIAASTSGALTATMNFSGSVTPTGGIWNISTVTGYDPTTPIVAGSFIGISTSLADPSVTLGATPGIDDKAVGALIRSSSTATIAGSGFALIGSYVNYATPTEGLGVEEGQNATPTLVPITATAATGRMIGFAIKAAAGGPPAPTWRLIPSPMRW